MTDIRILQERAELLAKAGRDKEACECFVEMINLQPKKFEYIYQHFGEILEKELGHIFDWKESNSSNIETFNKIPKFLEGIHHYADNPQRMMTLSKEELIRLRKIKRHLDGPFRINTQVKIIHNGQEITTFSFLDTDYDDYLEYLQSAISKPTDNEREQQLKRLMPDYFTLQEKFMNNSINHIENEELNNDYFQANTYTNTIAVEMDILLKDAISAFQKGKLDTAEQLFEKLLEIIERPELLNWLEHLRANKEGGFKAYKDNIDVQLFSVYYDQMQIGLQMNDKERTLKAVEHMIKRYPSHSPTYINACLAYNHFSQLKEAFDFGHKALDLAVNDQQKGQAHINLADAYMSLLTKMMNSNDKIDISYFITTANNSKAHYSDGLKLCKKDIPKANLALINKYMRNLWIIKLYARLRAFLV